LSKFAAEGLGGCFVDTVDCASHRCWSALKWLYICLLGENFGSECDDEDEEEHEDEDEEDGPPFKRLGEKTAMARRAARMFVCRCFIVCLLSVLKLERESC
jgi:hypothetical protein